MPYETGTITYTTNDTADDLFVEFSKFLTGAGPITFSGAASPTLKGYGELTDVSCDNGVTAETITVTCTNDTDPNAPVFSVSGSITGAMPNATGGVAYASNNLNFLIRLDWDNDQDGNPDQAYVNGDVFTFDTKNSTLVQDGSAWEIVRDIKSCGWFAGGAGSPYNTEARNGMVFRGKGGGSDNIYIRIYVQYYGSGPIVWRMRASHGIDLDADGWSLFSFSDNVCLTHWVGDIEYYFIANSRRFIIAARLGASGVTTSAYGGFMLPYALPSEYTYPVFLGGSSDTTAFEHSSTNGEFSAFFNSVDGSALLNTVENTWEEVDHYEINGSIIETDLGLYAGIEPWATRYLKDFTTTPAGDYYLMNAVVFSKTGLGHLKGTYGMLEGVYGVPGAPPLSSFDKLSVGADEYIVVNNHARNDRDNFAAFKLE